MPSRKSVTRSGKGASTCLHKRALSILPFVVSLSNHELARSILALGLYPVPILENRSARLAAGAASA